MLFLGADSLHSSEKKTSCVRSMSIEIIVSLLELNQCLKGILPVNHCFRRGDWLCWIPLRVFSSFQGTHVSLERKPPVQETGAYSGLLHPEKVFSVSKDSFPEIIALKEGKGSFCSK